MALGRTRWHWVELDGTGWHGTGCYQMALDGIRWQKAFLTLRLFLLITPAFFFLDACQDKGLLTPNTPFTET